MNLKEFFLSLPPLSIFAIILTLVLALPQIAQRYKLPGIVGLLFGGFLIGPHGLALLKSEPRVLNFMAELGVLLLMFFAGFEIDPKKFSQARINALIYGALTAIIPFACGVGVALLNGSSLIGAVLVGSLLGSHTLLGFPIVAQKELLENRAVITTVGATIFTDIFAMLVLALCIPIYISGFSPRSLAIQIAELAVYVPLIIFGVGFIAQIALKRLAHREETKLAVKLLLIAFAAQLAHLINLEGIVGAFLAGLAIRRAINEEKLVHVLDIIAKTLFIPAFFLSTGSLIDPIASAQMLLRSPLLVAGIVGGLIISKYISAYIAGHLLGFSAPERNLMWSLSIPQVAATLAAARVALQTVNASGVSLIQPEIFDAVLIMVLVTSITGPILTERYAKQVKEGI